jgi:hypothetical protein
MTAVPKPRHKRRVPKARNNPVPKEPKQCFICGLIGFMQTHECFGGSYRQLSIRYKLQVDLCDNCHRHITENKWLDKVRKIKKWGQRKFEETHSRDEFRRKFEKSYLD